MVAKQCQSCFTPGELMVVLWVIWIRFIITRTKRGGRKVCAQIVHMRSGNVMKDDANSEPGPIRSNNHTIF